jgi:hypothetical protein
MWATPCGFYVRLMTAYDRRRGEGGRPRAIGHPATDKPGVTALICHACESVSTQETRRRVQAEFGLLPLQEGRA